ncbi:hypothetical protein ANCCAN_07212 [Ancylostoma caninum]|uniref:Methyltransferase domain-containing protein n=1 Tax=Ancylostoma caninum TaxID=29170 RepID=A0A368GUR2_ANCCA|nr:hypothetical protein ANCCAN_07212 [Ancylostoma caninum]
MGIQVPLAVSTLFYSVAVIQLLHTLLKEVVLPPTMDNSEGFEFQLSLSANGLVGERIASRPNFSSEAAPSVVSRRMVELYKIQAIERRWSLQLILKRNPDFYHRLYNNLVPELRTIPLSASEENINVIFTGTLSRAGPARFNKRRREMDMQSISPLIYCDHIIFSRIPRSCTVFSVGLVNEVTFERELQYVTDYQCRIFAYDAGTQKRSTLKILEGIHGKLRQTSVKDETDVSRNQYTLMDLMKLEGVFKVDVLKIVIEGSGFMAFLRHHKPVQILLEMHGTPLEALKQLNYISRHGYWLYSYEVNGYLHNRAWYSFIHEDAMQQYGVTKLAKILDFSL